MNKNNPNGCNTDKLTEFFGINPENIVHDQDILCPHCHNPSGYTTNGLMFLVIMHDLLCLRCGKVVIAVQKISW